MIRILIAMALLASLAEAKGMDQLNWESGKEKKAQTSSTETRKPSSVSATWTDPSTGLMWQDEPYTDAESKAFYANIDHGKVLRWRYAKRYCDSLNYAGYTDWRLPSRTELRSIVNTSRYPAVKVGIRNIVVGWYLTSTNIPGPGDPWIVNFGYGNDEWIDKDIPNYVRCVRDSR